MQAYKSVVLDDADVARLASLTDKQQGVQRMIQMFVESGERRLAELQQEGRQTFTDFAEKYGLDLQHVQYVPSADGKKLVPKTVMLNAGE